MQNFFGGKILFGIESLFGGMSDWRMAVRLTSMIQGEKDMLELLLYCHMFARLKYAGEIMAVMDFVGELKARLRAPVPGRREPACGFGFWSERELRLSLDRLDAYAASVA
ncbi:MAG: hypothetical protein WBE48_26505 [Xanthobacteraceae bacterium]|jgi:hypothetical protein